jgi:enamine deaminase RidA (YjgF/YER057c/UK114 family)
MARRLITTNSPFGEKYGYSRAVVDGGFIFVAGTTGYDLSTMQIPDDVEAQTRNAFSTITSALEEAGSDLSNVVRATYFITHRDYIDTVLRAASSFFCSIRPATTLVVVSSLLHLEMKVEIEVTARTSR